MMYMTMYNVFGMKISHRYSKCLLLCASSCCSKLLSEIWICLSTKTQCRVGHGSILSRPNSIQNIQYLALNHTCKLCATKYYNAVFIMDNPGQF